MERWGRRKKGTDPGEVEASDEVTSMHGSRDDLVLGERESKRKNGSKRKQYWRWVVPLGESVYMGSVGTKSGFISDIL